MKITNLSLTEFSRLQPEFNNQEFYLPYFEDICKKIQLQHGKTKQNGCIICGNNFKGKIGVWLFNYMKSKKINVKLFLVLRHNNNQESVNDINSDLKKCNMLDIEQIKDAQFIDLYSIPYPNLNYEYVIDAILDYDKNECVSLKDYQLFFEQINNLHVPIYSVDSPSGYNPKSIKYDKFDVLPSTTTFLFLPKIHMFFSRSVSIFGNIVCMREYFSMDKIPCEETMPECVIAIENVLSRTNQFTNKHSYGQGLLIAGSVGMGGAAILAGRAAFRSGIGLLSIHIPAFLYRIMQLAIPEARCNIDKHKFYFTNTNYSLSRYNAIAIGPGLGTNIETIEGLKNVLHQCHCPIVIDADAINIIAKNRELLEILPENTIFTPHEAEFYRLLNIEKISDNEERMKVQQEFSKKYRCIVVFKGHYTVTSLPDGRLYFNTTGNAGMAVGGSGDVLTGIILSLLAQQISPEKAAIYGVFLHGKAGDYAANVQTQASIMPSDIINQLKHIKL